MRLLAVLSTSDAVRIWWNVVRIRACCSVYWCVHETRCSELFRPKEQWTLTAKKACEQAFVIFPEERNMENEAWSREDN